MPSCIWLWVKNGYPNWNPDKWNQGLKPAVFWWFHFDPYPYKLQIYVRKLRRICFVSRSRESVPLKPEQHDIPIGSHCIHWSSAERRCVLKQNTMVGNPLGCSGGKIEANQPIWPPPLSPRSPQRGMRKMLEEHTLLRFKSLVQAELVFWAPVSVW